MQRKGANIASRLLSYACNCLELAIKLPKGGAGQLICRQLIKSATSPGANYEEARSAESRSDFIHKVRVATKELRESSYWLQVAAGAQLLPSREVEPLEREADELIAILVASAKTASNRS